MTPWTRVKLFAAGIVVLLLIVCLMPWLCFVEALAVISRKLTKATHRLLIPLEGIMPELTRRALEGK